MSIILGFIPALFVLWIIWQIGRSIYRRIFFKKLVERNTRSHDSKQVLAMVKTLEENQQSDFKELATNATMNDLRALVSRGDVADHAGRIAVFPGYANSHPNDARAQYLHGSYLVKKGWAARGTGFADTVSDTAQQTFFEHLDSAEQALRRAIELDPEMPDPHADLVVIMRGRSRLPKVTQVQVEAGSLFPSNINIHRQMLPTLSERWMGSDAQVLSFAREHADQDKTGQLACLIPMAHFEVWYGNEDSNFLEYFKDKAIRKEIKAAFKVFLSSKNDAQQAQARLDALQYFACIFEGMGDTRNARKAFKKMKGKYSSVAWSTWKNPEERFVRAKWSAMV